jgi:hypothetical protein
MPNFRVSTLHAAFWSAPDFSLLDRPITAAGLSHSPRWLADMEAKGLMPKRFRVGRKWLYRKSDVLRHWGIAQHEGGI